MLYSAVSRYFRPPFHHLPQLDLCLEMRASFPSAKFNLLLFPLVASVSLPFPASAHFHVRCKTEFRSSNRWWGGGGGGVAAASCCGYTICYVYTTFTHTHTHTDAQGFHGVHWVNRAATAAFAIVAI